MPKLKHTDVIEVNDGVAYRLEWRTSKGIHYRASYIYVNDVPKLIIQYKYKQSLSYVTHTIAELNVDDLAKREMLKFLRMKHQIRKYSFLTLKYNVLEHSEHGALLHTAKL